MDGAGTPKITIGLSESEDPLGDGLSGCSSGRHSPRNQLCLVRTRPFYSMMAESCHQTVP